MFLQASRNEELSDLTAQHSSHASLSSVRFDAERWSLRVTEEGRFKEQKSQLQQLPNLNVNVCFAASDMTYTKNYQWSQGGREARQGKP